MIIERLVRLYAEPEQAILKKQGLPGAKLYKRESLKRRQQQRDIARQINL